MANDLKDLFPFITRDMLRFGRTAQLQLKITSQASVSAALQIRLATREGISEFVHTDSGDGLVQTNTFNISDIPIFVSITNPANTLTQGDCYVTLELLAQGEVVYVLCSGFVYIQKGISWPAASTADAIPGRGRIKMVTTTDPAAGASKTLAVPDGRIWHVLAARYSILNSATVANRIPQIIFTDASGNDRFTTRGQSYTVADAEETVTAMQWGAKPEHIVDTGPKIILPANLYVPDGSSLKIGYVSVQAGDQISTIIIWVEEFFTVPV